MPVRIEDILEAHLQVVRSTGRELSTDIQKSGAAIVNALLNNNRMLCFGNGGSASQADHFAGELVGRFNLNRAPLPALAFSTGAGLTTCIANDFGFDSLFERQVRAHAREGDVVVGLSTSGASQNVLLGLKAAREQRTVTVALTGSAGLAGEEVDFEIRVPSSSTARIQELHLLIIHAWCAMIDEAFATHSD